MRILNIHGYKGNPKNSMYRALLDNHYIAITTAIDYDSSSAIDTYNKLLNLAKAKNIEGIAGTSLGGFYALCLSQELKIPCFLANPALFPEVQLNADLHVSVPVTREYTRLKSKLGDFDCKLAKAVIGDRDEIVKEPYRLYVDLLLGSCRVIHIPQGTHSGSTLGLDLILKQKVFDYDTYTDETLS